MKKSKKIKIIAAVTASILTFSAAAFFIYSSAASTKVNSYIVKKTDIEQTVELNGTIESEKYQSFFSDCDGRIAKVNVKVGDTVKKGDLLISFDEERIDYLISLAECNNKINEGVYNDTIEQSNRIQALYTEATRNIPILDTQIAQTQEQIFDVQKRLTDRQSSFAGEASALQKSIIDITEKIANQKEDDKTDYSEQLANLQKLTQGNGYNQQYDEEIVAMQEELLRLNVQLVNFKEYKAQMVSQKAAVENARITKGQKEQLEAKKELDTLTLEDTINRLQNAKNGIHAEFDGIITEINVLEDMDIVSGMNLITIASSNDIILKCSANKYDILSLKERQSAAFKIGNTEYTGKISRIEKLAGQGTTPGIGVEIKVDKPDNNLILGLDVKSTVNVASASGVICVPRSATVEEDGKIYVFIEKDEKATAREVNTGISNDDLVEITSELNEDEVVIWSENKEIIDGMNVKAE